MNYQLVVTCVQMLGNRVEELLLAQTGQPAHAAHPPGVMSPETLLFPGADEHKRVHL